MYSQGDLNRKCNKQIFQLCINSYWDLCSNFFQESSDGTKERAQKGVWLPVQCNSNPFSSPSIVHTCPCNNYTDIEVTISPWNNRNLTETTIVFPLAQYFPHLVQCCVHLLLHLSRRLITWLTVLRQLGRELL